MFGFKKKKRPKDVQVEDIKETVQDKPEVIEEIPTINEEHAPIIVDSKGVKIEYPPADIKVRVSTDGMKAYAMVKLSNDHQPFTFEEFMQVIESSNIKHGVHTAKIKEFCERRLFYNEITLASGTQPIVGDDASIKYFFKIGNGVNLIEDEAGKVDYRELNAIQSVGEGSVLCTLTRETEGIPGIDVFGEPIPPKPGKGLELKFGENTKLSDDELSVVSTTSGCVDYKNGVVSITDLYTVRGDVNSAVGNLTCKGSILINGDVREGFTIKADKDIVIKGMIEGAHIIAGGNVTISSGMNGMNFGTIVAGGDIVCKYLENASIISQNGNVISDVIINCTTTANQSVIAKGGKGSIIGGTCTVGKMIYANFIGAHTNVPTSLVIESPELRKVLVPDTETLKTKQGLEASLINQTAERDTLKEQIRVLSASVVNDQDRARLKQLMAAKSDMAAEVAQTEAKIKELTVDTSSLGDYKIIALKTCFSGVKITIAYLYMHIDDDYSNTKFFVSDHKIIAGQVLPSDKIK